MIENFTKLAVALGLSETQIKSLQTEEAVSEETLHEIADSYLNTQRENISRDVIQKKKPEFMIEATNKARKAYLNELGIELDEELKLEKDFNVVVRKGLEKYKETYMSAAPDSKEEIEKWQKNYQDSQKIIKDYEGKLAETQSLAEQRYNEMVNNFYVEQNIMKLPMKEGVEFILPSEKVLKTFKGEALLEGIKFVKGEKGIEVLDKEGNPLQRKTDSRATEYHTLDTYFDEFAQPFLKRSNGNGGQPTPINVPTHNANLSPEQQKILERMKQHADNMN